MIKEVINHYVTDTKVLTRDTETEQRGKDLDIEKFYINQEFQCKE